MACADFFCQVPPDYVAEHSRLVIMLYLAHLRDLNMFAGPMARCIIVTIHSHNLQCLDCLVGLKRTFVNSHQYMCKFASGLVPLEHTWMVFLAWCLKMRLLVLLLVLQPLLLQLLCVPACQLSCVPACLNACLCEFMRMHFLRACVRVSFEHVVPSSACFTQHIEQL